MVSDARTLNYFFNIERGQSLELEKLEKNITLAFDGRPRMSTLRCIGLTVIKRHLGKRFVAAN